MAESAGSPVSLAVTLRLYWLGSGTKHSHGSDFPTGRIKDHLGYELNDMLYKLRNESVSTRLPLADDLWFLSLAPGPCGETDWSVIVLLQINDVNRNSSAVWTNA